MPALIEMGERCQVCGSWADEIYWSHFQFIHFAQFLHSGFDEQLALPKKFSDNLQNKLPENVVLKGPGGTLWNIGLTSKNDIIFLTRGWKQFVTDNCLEENDFLVFKYNGESQFDVLIFDQGSFCEKAVPYFVRKCGHTEHESECLNRRNDRDIPTNEVNTPSNAGVEFATPEKSTHGDNVTRVAAAVPLRTHREKNWNTPSNAGVEFATPEKSTHGDNVTRVAAAVPLRTHSEKNWNAGVAGVYPEKSIEVGSIAVPTAVPLRARRSISKPVATASHVQPRKRGRAKVSSISRSKALDWLSDSEPASAGGIGSSSAKTGSYEVFTSNRRPVTEEEKNNALLLARAACTDSSFIIVMRPTHVYKRFYASIPIKWATENMIRQNQDVILRMGGNEWHARYTLDRDRNNGGLSGGWKRFVLDNHLEEFDVCVFTPAGKNGSHLWIMDVCIFRVVEEIAPLDKMDSVAKR